MVGKAAIPALALLGLAAANVCNNNCGRQVVGTAAVRGAPALTARQSLCSSLLTSTTTVTPPAVTVPALARRREGRRNANANMVARDDLPTTTLVSVPAYATNCDPAEYYSACQCFSGVTPTLVTVTAPTPTATDAVCTQGLEYALFASWQGGPGGEAADAAIDEASVYGTAPVDVAAILSDSSAPLLTGVTPVIGAPQEGDYYSPIAFDNFVGPDGLAMGYNFVSHRGYLAPAHAGTYTFDVTFVDNIVGVWLGDSAVSGFAPDDAVLTAFLFEPNGGADGNQVPGKFSYQYEASGSPGEYVPLRIFFANGGGPAGLLMTITDPTGAVILGLDSQPNPQIIASCSGPDAPVGEWAAWSTST